MLRFSGFPDSQILRASPATKEFKDYQIRSKFFFDDFMLMLDGGWMDIMHLVNRGRMDIMPSYIHAYSVAICSPGAPKFENQ